MSKNFSGEKSCQNNTKLSSPHDEAVQTDHLNHVITVVVTVVGFIALLTIIVSVWLMRRMYLNKKARCAWELPVENENKSPVRLTRTSRSYSVTRLPDMYGGSLQDLRQNDERNVKVIVKRGLTPASSHSFLHRGDHNNTILNSLSATWSIQTLPIPHPPGERVIARASDNPLYARPLAAPARCASSNALYESADNILERAMQFRSMHCSRKDTNAVNNSHVYERIIDFQKKPRPNSLGKNIN